MNGRISKPIGALCCSFHHHGAMPDGATPVIPLHGLCGQQCRRVPLARPCRRRARQQNRRFPRRGHSGAAAFASNTPPRPYPAVKPRGWGGKVGLAVLHPPVASRQRHAAGRAMGVGAWNAGRIGGRGRCPNAAATGGYVGREGSLGSAGKAGRSRRLGCGGSASVRTALRLPNGGATREASQQQQTQTTESNA